MRNGIQTKPRDIPPGTISHQRFMNKTSALVAFRRLAHTLECCFANNVREERDAAATYLNEKRCVAVEIACT